MNKKLIALAVAGVCAAPTVMAQSANPVTLYGALRVDAEWVEAKGGPSGVANVPGRIRLTDHPSLIGVRGTEDLGGGLKAFFQLETAFAADDGSGQTSGTSAVATSTATSVSGPSIAFANRNSAVGLQGSFGSVGMGRWDMPMKQAFGSIDLWGDINKSDYTAGTMDQGNFSTRMGNSLMYWSPNWSGFQFKVHYAQEELRPQSGSPKPNSTGASLVYSKGPLTLAYAYEEHKQMNGDQRGTIVLTNGYKEEGNVFGGTFTMGNFKLAGFYGEFKKPVSQAAGAATGKDKSYYVGGQYTMGKNNLLVTYQNAKGENGTGECDVWGAGWQYVFTKRTNVMFSYVKVDNNTTMNCNFGAGTALGVNGQDPQGFGIGVRHYF